MTSLYRLPVQYLARARVVVALIQHRLGDLEAFPEFLQDLLDAGYCRDQREEENEEIRRSVLVIAGMVYPQVDGAELEGRGFQRVHETDGDASYLLVVPVF